MKHGEVIRVTDIYTKQELEAMDAVVTKYIQDNHNLMLQEQYGRVNLEDVVEAEELGLVAKMGEVVNKFSDGTLTQGRWPMIVEYSSAHGKPDLPPHYDGDPTDIIVDFQLSGNTTWGLGLNFGVEEIANNEAILFNPNKNIHWRPHKEFQEGEYIRMIFFRFRNKENPSDNSDMTLSQSDPAFDEVKAFRDSL